MSGAQYAWRIGPGIRAADTGIAMRLGYTVTFMTVP